MNQKKINVDKRHYVNDASKYNQNNINIFTDGSYDKEKNRAGYGVFAEGRLNIQ